ncbi:MAG: hypothetical protein C4341_01510 [Armatimonadota bacterium]
MSLSGHARHEHRSVNVELNLLTERLREQKRLAEQTRRWLLALAVSLIVAVLVVVGLVDRYRETRAETAKLKAKANELAEPATALQAKAEVAGRQLDVNAMLDATSQNTDRFMGALLSALNAMPPTVAISKLHAEVIGGTLTISGSADAEALRDAQDLVLSLKEGQVEAVLTSARRNDYLGAGGVGFEFILKTKVASK